MKMESRITDLLTDARLKIQEASTLIREVEVIDKVGEDYIIHPQFEDIVKHISEIDEAVAMITTDRKGTGSLDELKEYIKDKLKEFFREYHKQKRYEGDLMEIGYKVVERKDITDEAEEQFKRIEIRPNTEAINAYMKATRSDDNPDGLIPKGVIVNRFEYITYKPVLNDE